MKSRMRSDRYVSPLSGIWNHKKKGGVSDANVQSVQSARR